MINDNTNNVLKLRFALVLQEHRQFMVEDMKKSDHEKYIILSKK